jgi:2-(1,2-epoxy-1,2-dihydrophenyl)acetyl-CoA isomerase
MAGTEVLFETTDGLATITLNRPDKLNAATSGMLAQLLDAIRTAGADDGVRAVLITGAGRAFCAGQDLSDPAATGPSADLATLIEQGWNPIISAIRDIPKPVVVAVNGVAAGAGANLALAGDVVIAARSAKLIQAFSLIGLVPDSGGTWALPRLVGDARARGLSLFGAPIDAETARDWGMIWDVVDDDALAGEALEVARKLAAGPTRGYAAIKQAIDAAATNTLDEQLDLERDLQRELGRSRDYAEGVAAFMEKRKPRFEGR